MSLSNAVRGLTWLAIALAVGGCGIPEGTYDLQLDQQIPDDAMLVIYTSGGKWGGKFKDNRVRFQLPKDLLFSAPGLQMTVQYESVCGLREHALRLDGLGAQPEHTQRNQRSTIVGALKLRSVVPTIQLYVASDAGDAKVTVGNVPVRGAPPVEHLALPCKSGRQVHLNGKLIGTLPAELNNRAYFISADKNRCWAFTTFGEKPGAGRDAGVVTTIRSKRVFGFDDNDGAIDYFLKKPARSESRSGTRKLQVMPVDCSAGTALSKVGAVDDALPSGTLSGAPAAARGACQKAKRGPNGFAAPGDWLGPIAQTQALLDGLEVCMVAQFWEPVAYGRHPFPARRWDAALTDTTGAILMERVNALVRNDKRWKLDQLDPPAAPKTVVSASRDHITVMASIAPPRVLVSAKDVMPTRVMADAFLDAVGDRRAVASAVVDGSRAEPRKFTFLCDFNGQNAVNFGFSGDGLLGEQAELRRRGFKRRDFDWHKSDGNVTWKYGPSYFSVAHEKKVTGASDHVCARWNIVEKRYIK